MWNWGDINREAILKTIEENRDLIKGIKIRAVGALAESLGVKVVKTGKEIAREAGLPIMVHIGKDPPETTPADILEKLTRQAVAQLGIEANVTKVQDFDAIMAYDITSTPALVVDEVVVVSGRVPRVDEIAALLRPA